MIDLADGLAPRRLHVTGTATLGGALRAVAGAGFDPTPGERFEILTAASVVDRFDVAFLPGLSEGRFLRVEYTQAASTEDGSRGAVTGVSLMVDTINSRGVDLEDPLTASTQTSIDSGGSRHSSGSTEASGLTPPPPTHPISRRLLRST